MRFVSSGWELGFEFWIIKRQFLENLDSHETDALIKTESLLNESSPKNGNFLMETLIGGIIFVVSEKY